jgi:hypothetical protein
MLREKCEGSALTFIATVIKNGTKYQRFSSKVGGHHLALVKLIIPYSLSVSTVGSSIQSQTDALELLKSTSISIYF